MISENPNCPKSYLQTSIAHASLSVVQAALKRKAEKEDAIEVCVTSKSRKPRRAVNISEPA